MTCEELIAPLTAVLFAAGEPQTPEKLCGIFDCGQDVLEAALSRLERRLAGEDSGIILQSLAGGYRLATKQEYYPYIEKLHQLRPKKLSAPLMETLAIIAFRQPVTRQEIEAIRGVSADSAVSRLLEMELIKEAGRKDVLGRPILFRTTENFLASFGLDDLSGLPELPAPDMPEQGEDFVQLSLLSDDANNQK